MPHSRVGSASDERHTPSQLRQPNPTTYGNGFQKCVSVDSHLRQVGIRGARRALQNVAQEHQGRQMYDGRLTAVTAVPSLLGMRLDTNSAWNAEGEEHR